MANPTLTGLIPDIIVAMRDVISRELVGFASAVTLDADAARAAKGDNIQFSLAPGGTAEDITPAATVPTTGAQTFDKVTMTLDKMRAVPFIWEGERKRAAAGNYLTWRQQQIAQGIRTLINEIETDIGKLYKGASRAYGTAGTTPFASDLSDVAQLQKILDDNGAPMGDRQLVIDTSAFVKLGSLAQLTNVSQAGEADLLRRGVLTDLFGFQIRKSAKVQTHTKGTGASYLVNDTTPPGIDSGTSETGKEKVTVDTGTGTIVAGDVVTFAGDTNKYLVEAALASNVFPLNRPGLRVALDDNDTVTVGATYVASMAFSRSAIAAAIRPPALPGEGDLSSDRQIITDPVSGISLEFAVYPGYYQNRYEVCAVWGAQWIKSAHMAVLLG